MVELVVGAKGIGKTKVLLNKAAEAVKNGNVITLRANLSDNDPKIEFTKMGDWMSVQCEKGTVPNKVIPEKILKEIPDDAKELKNSYTSIF